jgi:starch synthase (maltosyl-transferring)
VAAVLVGSNVIPIIYAEVSIRLRRIEELAAALPSDRFRRDAPPWEAAFLAGKSFVKYRRPGGARRAPLPDFYVGAHAAVAERSGASQATCIIHCRRSNVRRYPNRRWLIATKGGSRGGRGARPKPAPEIEPQDPPVVARAASRATSQAAAAARRGAAPAGSPAKPTLPQEGRRRAVIEAVTPLVDGGRFPVKRCVGDLVVVEADVFADGHDAIRCVLRHRHEGDATWSDAPMKELSNDRWRGAFRVTALGRHRYALLAWVDHFVTWRRDLSRWVEAGLEIGLHLDQGAELVRAAAARAPAMDAARLEELASGLGRGDDTAVELALSDDLAELMERHPDRTFATEHDPGLWVEVDPLLARYGAWYEIFPRSASREPGRPGTLADVEARLPEIAAMGFDVLYLPPIHPIGRTKRKGRNNAAEAAPDDVGSPWAIGATEGGHKDVHPALGDLRAFRRLVRSARERYHIEIALDIAFQTSADHPYLREHPEWFRMRPDGTIQYAENPPKRYEDIYPFDFETAAWRDLWLELNSIFEHWIEQGVRVFRVDNPHTKPFPFWEWLISELKRGHPDLILLAEAFTRPKVMYRLAKLGFSQSYTYFAWRNTKWELEQYLTELTRTEVREFFRPGFWPNTPDILTEYLQTGGRAGFVIRLVLAATLSASYGIYGPAYELLEGRPREPGGEEYQDSEKYQIRAWDRDATDNLRDLVARINRIRRDNAPLQHNASLRFHPVDNARLLAYSKTDERHDVILTVVNLDPFHTQSGWVDLPLDELGIDPGRPFQVHDLLSGARYPWQGSHNYVELDPAVQPAHIFRVRRRVRTERDFEYFM